MKAGDADMLARRLHTQRAQHVASIALIDEVLTVLGCRGELVSTTAKTSVLPQQIAPIATVSILEQLAQCWDACGTLGLGPALTARLREVQPVLDRLAAERDTPVVELFGRACERFKSDPKLNGRRFGLRVLLSQIEQWVDPMTAMGGPPPLTKAQREYQEAVLAAEEASAKWPGQDWLSDQLKPFTERLQLAKEALDKERGIR
jgi:hypothetical protein